MMGTARGDCREETEANEQGGRTHAVRQRAGTLSGEPPSASLGKALRRELAARHLSERRLAISEIAFLLGFSEPSAFHRAFKRWTGHAPLA